jgi:hypothetical protein
MPAHTLRVAFFGEGGAYDEDALWSFLRDYPAIVVRRRYDSIVVDKSALEELDLVILDQPTRPFEPSEADALEKWVHAGGSLMSLTGYRIDTTDRLLQNELLRGFGISYEPNVIFFGPMVGRVTDFTPHPLSKGLTSVPFNGGYHVARSGSAPSGSLARGEGGDVAVWLEDGSGRCTPGEMSGSSTRVSGSRGTTRGDFGPMRSIGCRASRKSKA